MNNKANVWLGFGITVAVIILIALMLVGWVAGTYNTLVATDTSTAQKL